MPPPHDTRHFDDSVRFIMALSTAIDKYGGHTHDTDNTIRQIIKTLGLKGEILAVPNTIIIALWQDDLHHQTIHIATTRGTSYDMTRFGMVRDLIVDVEAGRISPADGVVRLKEIEHAPSLYGNYAKAAAFFLAGVGFGVILGISWLDVFFGGVLGLAAFGVELLASRSGLVVNNTPELFISLIVALLAGITGVVLPGIHPLAVTVCALTIYIPGFALTIAPREILLGDSLSGIMYFTNALFVSVKLLLGTFLGLGIALYLFPVAVTEPLTGVDPLFVWVFIPFLLISNSILFGVSWDRLWLVIVCGLVVWAGVTLGNTVGFWQGTFLGAIILALYTRIAARRFNLPLATVLLPVVLILVPGYTFIQVLYLFNAGQMVAGISAGFQMVALIFAIICGIFIGDILGSWKGLKREQS
ncbi:threonine/serine exporter family protein [Methanoregula sp.]|uniref:threonine/serine ThrE exporter family protein n=1 Tax=Methanoregula sp. TaxID=2052170 RepID=UPI00236A9211|nr:threonine/serine exporter family protein [Methanoregula sp.]MDD1686165.1 threonine/serine exporter family protein [Methanoregula sp.]